VLPIKRNGSSDMGCRIYFVCLFIYIAICNTYLVVGSESLGELPKDTKDLVLLQKLFPGVKEETTDSLSFLERKVKDDFNHDMSDFLSLLKIFHSNKNHYFFSTEAYRTKCNQLELLKKGSIEWVMKNFEKSCTKLQEQLQENDDTMLTLYQRLYSDKCKKHFLPECPFYLLRKLVSCKDIFLFKQRRLKSYKNSYKLKIQLIYHHDESCQSVEYLNYKGSSFHELFDLVSQDNVHCRILLSSTLEKDEQRSAFFSELRAFFEKSTREQRKKIITIIHHMHPCLEGTLLHYAARHREDELIAFLLDNSIFDINVKNAFGATPLMIACYFNRDAFTVDFLLQKGAKVNEEDNNKNTALILLSLFNPNENIAQLLLQYGADSTKRNEDGDKYVSLNSIIVSQLRQLKLMKQPLPQGHDDKTK
jgi:hypothetical protein